MDYRELPVITDEQMNRRLAQARAYSLVLLRTTPETFKAESRPIIREHGRRNIALHAHGTLPVVCPVTDGSEVAGIGIFAAETDEVRVIMDNDPAVKARILTYEIHPVRGFPGSALPGRKDNGAHGGRRSADMGT